ncbi:AhpC/TSA family protein [Granulicella pectinivorans]|jgi:peroxiredoxin|uniref:AhpC/TSA family protein n=1 Tax=Granulicella pectinivorans TaxID=474950 RepID=A0A1I6MYP3_9BACT|nr:redoxin domain-containing protein [Granulicella pectinivorans]SFS20794.1 AhpC/TSA family protein [Granulicella pectinivorans]
MLSTTTQDLSVTLAGVRTESGVTLLSLTGQSPVLLIFLRHFGCSFCRQAISDVANLRDELSRRNVRPVFVHLGTPERARPFFDYYHLPNVERISDPAAILYRTPPFGLRRQHWSTHFFIPKVIQSWLTGSIKKYGIGSLQDDANQMPGIFFLKDGKVARTFLYKTIADQPPYLKLIA